MSAALLGCLLQGCMAEQEPVADIQPVVDSQQFMNWILDPNADVIWGSAGTIMTLEGDEDLAPTTDEGWNAVRNAAATLAGQNLGAKQPDRAEKSVWRCGWYTMGFLGIVGLVFFLDAETLVRIFTSDPAVVPMGGDCRPRGSAVTSHHPSPAACRCPTARPGRGPRRSPARPDAPGTVQVRGGPATRSSATCPR